MNAQSSLHIILQETIKNDTLTIKFKNNFNIQIRPLKIPLIENNMAELYSKELYNHIHQLDLKEPCFVVMTDPLKSELDQRFQFLAQLAVDTILKLLNLRIIPIVITSVGEIQEEIPSHNTILHNFVRQSQQILTGGTIKKKVYADSKKKFEENYRIQVLNYYTLEPIGATAQPQTDTIIYCPTKELIQIKTNLEYEVTHEIEELRRAIEKIAQDAY